MTRRRVPAVVLAVWLGSAACAGTTQESRIADATATPTPTSSALASGPFKDGGAYRFADVVLDEASCRETPARDPLDIVPNPARQTPGTGPVNVDLAEADVAAVADTIGDMRLRVAADGTLLVSSAKPDRSATMPWVGNVDRRNPARLSFTSVAAESGDRTVRGVLLVESDLRGRLNLEWRESTMLPPWFGPAHADPARCEADAVVRVERTGDAPPPPPPPPSGLVVVAKAPPPPPAGGPRPPPGGGLSTLTWFIGESGTLGLKDADAKTVAVGTGIPRGGAYVVVLDGTAGGQAFSLRGTRTADGGFRCTLSAAGGEAALELA